MFKQIIGGVALTALGLVGSVNAQNSPMERRHPLPTLTFIDFTHVFTVLGAGAEDTSEKVLVANRGAARERSHSEHR